MDEAYLKHDNAIIRKAHILKSTERQKPKKLPTAAENLRWQKTCFRIRCRDKGCCTLCGLNIEDLAEAIAYVQRKIFASALGWGTALDPQAAFAQFRYALGLRMGWTRRIWEVDHITPKSRGGTDADDNLRLLCWKCHRKETSRVIYGR